MLLSTTPAAIAASETQTRSHLDVTSLYRRHGGMVLARCRQMLGNEADAEEALQEVFLKVVRFQDSFREEAQPSTWLYRVATNTCLTRLRTRRRRPETLLDDVGRTLDAAGRHTGSAEADVGRHRALDRILQLADERTRACLVYVLLDGMTYEEAAPLVGVTASAIRKRVDAFRRGVQESGGREAL